MFTTSVSIPVLTTKDISGIEQFGASGGGNISTDGGAPITARGICWSTSTNPTTDNTKTNEGNSTGEFISALTGLLPNTAYYVKAYASNSMGTAYGNEVTFITLAHGTTITDFEGNVYNVQTIGTQVWMLDNLKSTQYADGTNITGYYYPNGASENVADYGLLYTPSAALRGSFIEGAQGVCPNNYHVPYQNEIVTLFTTISSLPPNSTGFAPVAAGQWYNGSYYLFQSLSSMLTSTTSSNNTIWYGYSASSATSFAADNTLQAQSVRCVKNN